ncbi:hypothetical protein FO440_14775 [Mucilaginibacter corticis]|uniref:Uncharacterized protein n=1 Tax=Mucilaginibacter corticis TaxID=2597670 RepID=A0A556MM99_9SPHI|nr:hypothetical protein [Mucilaginibacter corticis]TSJ40995.1 hypothetical protein FO440_14775 [Mucilaginibacter corticis]
MEPDIPTQVAAGKANARFERKMKKYLRKWVRNHEERTLLKFDQPPKDYLANDALRDFFLSTGQPLLKLLKHRFAARHLSRPASEVYFDEVTGDPLFAPSEQRIYNLARRMDSERMHIPFRSVHPVKQTAAGDTAPIDTYPPESQEIRYNSGNHFSSRPANSNVFDENSRRCSAKAGGNLHILFKRGFMEDRLQEIKSLTTGMQQTGETLPQFFVICSRHSLKEGHYGVSLVIMDPANPDFPKRVIVCDTLLKELPHHPRWWNHFVGEYSLVFGNAVVEILEDLSHPLQKVNIKGDHPYRHDWDCPYYASGMANALADLVNEDSALVLAGSAQAIHDAMKDRMPDYYRSSLEIKDRQGIQLANRLKRWNSGRDLVQNLTEEISRKSAYER